MKPFRHILVVVAGLAALATVPGPSRAGGQAAGPGAAEPAQIAPPLPLPPPPLPPPPRPRPLPPPRDPPRPPPAPPAPPPAPEPEPEPDRTDSGCRFEVDKSGGTIHCDLCPVYCTRTVCTTDGCHDESYVCGHQSCNCRPGA